MRKHILAIAACGLFSLAACSNDLSGPRSAAFGDAEVIDLVPDYAFSSAAEIDGAGIGASRFPEGLQLTAEQKAAITALHESFAEAHADELAQLKDLEKQMRELKRSGGTREQFLDLLRQAQAIHTELADDFAALQDAIWAIYTPEQKAWIESHRPKVCGPNGPPTLTDAQVQQIRALREAFQAAVAADLAVIKQAHHDARAARQAGKSQAEIDAILAAAKDEMERVRAAEHKLGDDILAVLTPEQRAAWCLVRRHVKPRNG